MGRTLGKIAVLFNVLFSGLLACWALALYTNNADWSDSPGSADKAAGLVAQRRAAIAEVQKGYPPAETSYRSARAVLLVQESIRKDDQAWFARELRQLLAAGPTHQVRMDPKTHLPVTDPRNADRPVMDPGKDRTGNDLQPLEVYDKESKTLLEQLVAAQAEQKKLITEDIALTDLIVGTPDKKGLQQRLIDERLKREGVKAEQEIVEPLWKVAEVNTQLLLRRQESLQERIKELQEYLQRKHNVKVAGR